MPTLAHLRTRTLSSYHFTLPYRTRWLDNDTYAHLNNSIYQHLFDSVINAYLASHCGQNPSTSPSIGLIVHSEIDFLGSVEFPQVAVVGLRVVKLGKASVVYECGVFVEGREAEGVKAVGRMVHVFVESKGRRPMKEGMPEKVREGLRALALRAEGDEEGEGGQVGEKKAKL